MATFQGLNEFIIRFNAFNQFIKALQETQEEYLVDSDWEEIDGGNDRWKRADGEIMTREQAVKSQIRVDERALEESTLVLGEEKK